MPTIPRRSLLAAAALSPLGAIPLNADRAPGLTPALTVDPDAQLHSIIAEYHALFAEDAAIDGAPLNLDRRFEILDAVAGFRPETPSGAIAKLRFGFDDDAIRLLLGSSPFEQVGGRALLDVFRLTKAAS